VEIGESGNDMDPTLVASLIISALALIIAVLTYSVQRRSAKVHHLMPALDRILRVLQDINSAASSSRLLKTASYELQKKDQKPSLTRIPFAKMFIYTYIFSLQSIVRLNQSCNEFLNLQKDLMEKGTIEGIRRMDSSLIWEFHKIKDMVVNFLRLDISKLLKTEDKLDDVEIRRLSEEISGKATELEKASRFCIKKLEKLLP